MMMNIMKKIFLITWILFICASVGSAKISTTKYEKVTSGNIYITSETLSSNYCIASSLNITNNLNLNEFQFIEATDKGLKITFKNSGIKYNCKIGNDKYFISKYGGIIFIPFGANAQFIDKHDAIFFNSIKGEKSYIVRKETDLRSFGGEVHKNSFLLRVQSGKIKLLNLPEDFKTEK